MLKAKTFVKEVPRSSGLGSIYSYRYKKKKKDPIDEFLDENEGRSSAFPNVSTDVPDGMFHASEGPSKIPQKDLDELTNVPDYFDKNLQPRRAGFRPIPKEDYDETPSTPSYPKSGYRRITPKRWKPPVKKQAPLRKKAPVKAAPKKERVIGDVDFAGPMRTEFRKANPAQDLFRGIPKRIERKDLGLKERPKTRKSYGVPPRGATFKYPKTGGPYSNQQQEQLRKSDVQVGGGAMRAGSIAAIGAMGAGAIGASKKLAPLIKRLRIPKYRSSGTPNPRDPLNRVLHTPPIPRNVPRRSPVRPKPKKTAKSARSQEEAERYLQKQLYKIFRSLN